MATLEEKSGKGLDARIRQEWAAIQRLKGAELYRQAVRRSQSYREKYKSSGGEYLPIAQIVVNTVQLQGEKCEVASQREK